MSRSSAATQTQLLTLIDFLERNLWLANGHARTAGARYRTRNAWQEIGYKLNDDAEGCVKTWQQWAKYWKDKKAGIKRKATLMRSKSAQNAGEEEDYTLTELEERVMQLIGKTEIKQTKEVKAEVDPLEDCTSQQATSPNESESEVLEETSALTSSSATVQPTSRNSHNIVSSRRQRRIASNWRRLHRSSSSRMLSQIFNLTERFVSIEERRSETENLLAQSQRELTLVLSQTVGALQNISAALSKQSQAFEDFVRNNK